MMAKKERRWIKITGEFDNLLERDAHYYRTSQ